MLPSRFRHVRSQLGASVPRATLDFFTTGPLSHPLASSVSVFYDSTEGRSSTLMQSVVFEVSAGGDGHTSSHMVPSWLLRLMSGFLHQQYGYCSTCSSNFFLRSSSHGSFAIANAKTIAPQLRCQSKPRSHQIVVWK
jgi:hypothetical protein